jgi:predicted transcriptional regulator
MKSAFQPTSQHLRIKVQMMKKGLSSRELAQHLGVHESAVSNALAGRRPEMFRKVAEFVKSFEPSPAS